MLDDSHIASSLIIIKIQLMKLLTFLIVALFGVAAAYTVATCTETLEIKCVDAIIAGTTFVDIRFPHLRGRC